MPKQVSFAAAMPRDPAPGLTLACGVIPSGSNPIEIRRCSGRSHRPGVRPWYAFHGAGPVGGKVKSHCSRSGVRPQCDLMPKAPPKTCVFDLKGTGQTDYLGVPLMDFGRSERDQTFASDCFPTSDGHVARRNTPATSRAGQLRSVAATESAGEYLKKARP